MSQSRPFVLMNKTGVMLHAATGFVHLTAQEMDRLCDAWQQHRAMEQEETMKMHTHCLQAAQKATREIYDCVTQPEVQVVLPGIEHLPTAKVPVPQKGKVSPGQFKIVQR